MFRTDEKPDGFYWAILRCEATGRPEIIELSNSWDVMRAGNDYPFDVDDCLWIADTPIPAPTVTIYDSSDSSRTVKL